MTEEIPLSRLLHELQSRGYEPVPAEAYPTFVEFWAAVPDGTKREALDELGLTLVPLDGLEVNLVGEGDDAVVVLNPVDASPSPLEDDGDGPTAASGAAMDQPLLERDEASARDEDGSVDDATVEVSDPVQIAAAEALIVEDPASVQQAAAVVAAATAAAASGPSKPGLPAPAPDVSPEGHPLEEIDLYVVNEPFGYVRVTYDAIDHRRQYHVIEPVLDDRESKILKFLEGTIIDVIDVGLAELEPEKGNEMLIKLVDEILVDYSLQVDAPTREKLLYFVKRDFLGFGPLDVLMKDPMIEDVSCDGPHVPIFLYHRKFESLMSNVKFKDDDELDSYVIKLAQRSGKHISIAEPLLDATLPDGSRLNATLSDEVTANGSTFTVRKFKPEPFTPPDLVRFGSMSPEMLAYLWMGVQHGASLLYAGGTASGKTTALNAIMLFIPPQMKIVTIEDTREVNLPHPNWIPGTTRSGFGPRDNRGHQAGEIDMFTLLKAALRQRPEYIIVGEVRGVEAIALFQAMATGHSAYGTMHADSVEAVIHRLESEPINVPRSLIEALDIVSIQMQTRIGGKRVRRTKEIVEIVGLDPNTKDLLTNEVFRWDSATDTFEASGISYVLERLQLENNMTRQELQSELENRQTIIQWMIDRGVRNYQEVARIVQSYYNEPKETMQKVRADLGIE